MDLGPNLALGLLDISETGVRMVVKERLSEKEEISLALEGPSHRQPLRRVARVVWCLETAEQTFCIGALFDKRLLYADLGKLT
jgi:hypothetical protein